MELDINDFGATAFVSVSLGWLHEKFILIGYGKQPASMSDWLTSAQVRKKLDQAESEISTYLQQLGQQKVTGLQALLKEYLQARAEFEYSLINRFNEFISELHRNNLDIENIRNIANEVINDTNEYLAFRDAFSKKLMESRVPKVTKEVLLGKLTFAYLYQEAYVRLWVLMDLATDQLINTHREALSTFYSPALCALLDGIRKSDIDIPSFKWLLSEGSRGLLKEATLELSDYEVGGFDIHISKIKLCFERELINQLKAFVIECDSYQNEEKLQAILSSIHKAAFTMIKEAFEILAINRLSPKENECLEKYVDRIQLIIAELDLALLELKEGRRNKLGLPKQFTDPHDSALADDHFYSRGVSREPLSHIPYK